jgi:hypothetical protein
MQDQHTNTPTPESPIANAAALHTSTSTDSVHFLVAEMAPIVVKPIYSTTPSQLLGDRLDTKGELTTTNWSVWSKLIGKLTGAICGDLQALKKLDGKTAKLAFSVDATEQNDWIMGTAFKELVEQYGGGVAAARIRELDPDNSNVSTLWDALASSYSHFTSGSERTLFLTTLVYPEHDETTTSFAHFSSTLRLAQLNPNDSFQ